MAREALLMQGELQDLRAKAQGKEQTELVQRVLILEAKVQALLPPTLKSSSRRGPAPTTRAWITAIAAYYDGGQDLGEDMRPGTLAHHVAKFGTKIGLAEAYLLEPDNETAREIMKAFLDGIRKVRARDRQR
jgi:hypothetical protein